MLIHTIVNKRKVHCIKVYERIVLCFIVLLFLGCVNNEVTLEEAKEIAVSMRDEKFVPPPRKIDDILSLLDQQGSFDTEITNSFKEVINEEPPEGASLSTLGQFYMKRGSALSRVGFFTKAHADMLKAYSYYDDVKNNKVRGNILFYLAALEKSLGNINRAVELLKKLILLQPNSSRSYTKLISAYKIIGKHSLAERTAQIGIIKIQERITKMSSSIEKRTKFSAQISNEEVNLADIRAQLFHLQGKHEKEEKYWREKVAVSEKSIEKVPVRWINAKISLANYLYNRKRFVEAELVAREAVENSIGLSGKINSGLVKAIRVIAKIKLAQGRLDEAEKLARHLLVILSKSEISNDSSAVANGQTLLAKILTSKGDHPGAVKVYDFLVDTLLQNKNLLNSQVVNPETLLSLIEVGRAQEAHALITRKYDEELSRKGDSNISTVKYLALRGLSNYKLAKVHNAYEDFSKSIPLLYDAHLDYGAVLFNSIIENYMTMLSSMAGSEEEREVGIDAAAIAFTMAEALRGRTVQTAVTAANARTTVANPELADFIRKEQDSFQQQESLQETLSNIWGLAPAEQDSTVVDSLKGKINNLVQARKAFLKEIKTRFPNYSELIKPSLPTVKQVQSVLGEKEALVSIYAGKDQSYIWVVPKGGKYHFFTADLNRARLKTIVTELRKSLNPEVTTLGDIPPFDVNTAYILFSALLKPAWSSLSNIENIVVIADGPLGAFPFAVLPSSPDNLETNTGKLFGEYLKVAWLIRKFTISRMPSASTLLSLRKVSPGDLSRKAFAGFGDPLFNIKQQVEARSPQRDQPMTITSRGGALKLRGIRIAEKKSLDSGDLLSLQLKNLMRLPDC